ncbi:MAG: hypothetical protein ACRC92_15850, partial [Peptostreptococcaceae bacterium]
MDEERNNSNNRNEDEEINKKINDEVDELETPEVIEDGEIKNENKVMQDNIENIEESVEEITEDKNDEESIQVGLQEESYIENDTKVDENDIKEGNEENQNIKKKKYIILGSALLVVVIFSIFINVFVGKYEKIAYPGSSVYGEDVSKLNEEELDKKLNELSNKLNENE